MAAKESEIKEVNASEIAEEESAMGAEENVAAKRTLETTEEVTAEAEGMDISPLKKIRVEDEETSAEETIKAMASSTEDIMPEGVTQQAAAVEEGV